MKETLQKLPPTPGVYQYFDERGKLLYVGKAKSLKNRVKSYWRFSPVFKPNPTQSPRILKMLDEAKKLEYIVVESEEDALILENSLIKQLKPKYNILLRDDKTYPYIYIDESSPFPRFEMTRKVIKGKNITYYGPFPTGGRALLDSIYEVYPLVQKKSCLQEGKACLFYQIGKCLAPCEKKVSPQDYAKIIEKAKQAIVKRKTLIIQLEERMMQLATQERYEEAGKTRDSIQAIASLNISSNIDLANGLDLDIFAILNGDERGVIVKLFMRNGKIISSSHNYFRHTHIFDLKMKHTNRPCLSFILVDTPQIAKQILTAHTFEDALQVENKHSLPVFQKKLRYSHPKLALKQNSLPLP